MSKRDRDTRQSWGLSKTEDMHSVFPLQESKKVETRVLTKMMKGNVKDRRRATVHVLAEQYLGMAQRLEKELGYDGFRDIQKKLQNFQANSFKDVIHEILKER